MPRSDVDQQPLSLRATRAALHRLAALPPRVLRVLAGRSVTVDGQTLLPEAQIAIRFLNAAPGESFERLPLEHARAELDAEAWLFGATTHIAHVENRTVDGADGPLPARLYDPHPGRTKDGVLLWFHGGGYVLGGLDTSDPLCRFLARSSGLLVLSVDYRLAPEHPYPAGQDDAVAATRWALAHLDELGARSVVVAGESAGGGLSAHVARVLAADPTAPALAGQVLVSPWLDLASESRSYELFGEGYTLTRDQLDWYRDHYLPDQELAVEASAARPGSLAGVAPALVVVAGFDALRDEALAYADRLEADGVPVERMVEAGLPHSALNATGVSRRVRDAVDEIGRAAARLAAAAGSR